MTQPRAFIFDLDGTLVDSLRDIADALNAALRDLNRPPAALDQVRQWVGGGLPSLCARAAPDADEDALRRLIGHAMGHYETGCVHHTRPFVNILKMLDLLQEGRAPLAVLSNKPHALTVRVLEALRMDRFFRLVQGYTHEADKKPSPTVPGRIAERLGVPRPSVFLVGDSATDVQTARNAGMVAVAVTWGFRRRDELVAAGPDFLVDDALEIPRLPLGPPR